MGLLEDVLAKLGAVWDRTHIFTFLKDSEDGVFPRFTRDLRPVPEDGLTGGHLLELYTVFDRRHTLDANSVIRYDALEEDWLFTGGPDDRAISLLGTGAAPPEADAPTRQLTTVVRDLPPRQSVARAVEDFKRSRNDFADTIFVLRENPNDTKPGERRSHVIAWYRLEHQADDIGALSEFYFVVDVGGQLQAASPVIELAEAPPGTSVRLRGSLTDLNPLVGAQPEPLENVPATLAGRRSVTDDQGRFLIDARLPVGNNALRIARPGIDAVELTVEVTEGANGRMTAAVLDPDGNQVVAGTTPQAATEASLIELAIPAAITVRVHKLRGTILWPDSRPGNVLAAYHGTPLGKRHVYVLPLPAGSRIRDRRPKTTREWEGLKRSPDVLRSTRPGRPREREATDLDGRFEVKYVDFNPDNRFLIWVERVVPGPVAGTTSEEPDHVVRTFRQELIELTRPDLVQAGNAGNLLRQNRNLVDHEYNFAEADVVQYGVDALRTAQFPAGRRLVRPRRDLARPDGLREMRNRFDGDAALVAGVDEERAVANTRLVDGLELQVLPLVPLHEPPEDQGEVARRVGAALAGAAAAAYPDYMDAAFPAPVPAAARQRFGGYDAAAVRLALDARGIQDAPGVPPAVSMNAADWTADEPNNDARVVKLLESTFVVRDQLGVGRTLTVGQAKWHIDAVSLADCAFVSASPAGAPVIANRSLDDDVVPVFRAVSPRLPGLGARRVYIAPGHGLFPRDGNEASVAVGDWRSPRGGYGGNAGEDEVDALLASEMRRIAVVNGGSVVTCRELVDFTLPGVSNPANGNFAPVTRAANDEFPRLWQQNAVYYLGFNADPVVIAPPANPATAVDWPNPATPGVDPDGNQITKNRHGIDARREHMRAAARAADPIALALAPHTNAVDQATRGTLVEYLNMLPAAGAGEGNPLGRSFARQLLRRFTTRCRTGQNGQGVFTMNVINNVEVTDLSGTFDHFVEDTGIDRHRERRRAAAAAPAANWNDMPFPFDVRQPMVMRIPVALSELLFHDEPNDAALLSRAWFRRLAAEAATMGMDNQLRDDPTAVVFPVLQRMLRNTFGDSAAVRRLVAAPVTPASIQAAIVAVADPDPAPAVPADASLGSLANAVTAAVRAFTRQELVDVLVGALRAKAGWEPGDLQLDIEEFVTRPIVGAQALDRPADTPTRAEAGAFACSAVGLTPATLRTAETNAVGDPAAPLFAAAPPPRGVGTTYFSRADATQLLARLDDLEVEDIYNVVDVWLADASWTPLDSPLGTESYEVDAGTPLVVVVRTAGVAWKADDQNGTDEAGDVEIGLEVGWHDRTLACTYRDGSVAASETWALDLPATDDPLDVTIDLRVDHADEGWTTVGEKRIKLKVVEPQA